MNSTTPSTPPSATGHSSLSWIGCAFAFSLAFNFIAVCLLILACAGLLLRETSFSDDTHNLSEKYLVGSRTARNRVAVVRLDGVIMEGMLSHVHKQIEQAASDNDVKSVVLRVNSPGGTITASDDLYRRILKLRDGDPLHNHPAKPLVTSFGSIAASGGYYVAAPAQLIMAEPRTITGSIGVYGSFPNVQKLADTYGATFTTIKAGEIKDMGGMFKEMTPRERQVIQDQIDDAYVRFLDIIEKGRPKLTKAVMLERFRVSPINPDIRVRPAAEPYERYRADGGVFNGSKAKDLGLVDSIGFLEDAVQEAAKLAGLSEYRGIEYLKPKNLTDILLNARASSTPWDSLQATMSPRLWYLDPSHELAVRLSRVTTP